MIDVLARLMPRLNKFLDQIWPSVVATLIAAGLISGYNHAFSGHLQRPRMALLKSMSDAGPLVDQGTQLTMSVCTGAFILSKAGLTHHKRITSHWSAVDSLQRFDPQATVLKDKRFVEDGKLLTTAGVSAGIDGALRVVEELRGPDEAISVAHLMQYDKWQPAAGVVIGKSGIRPPAPLAASVAHDPVCQMPVPSKEALRLDYKGATYHFCSPGCRDNFRRHPAQYVSK